MHDLLKAKLKPIKKLYKKIKNEANQAGEENNFLKTLISAKELEKNMDNVI